MVSGWRNRPLPTLVSIGPADGSEANLRAEIAKLERRVKVLTAVMIVLLALVRISTARLNNARLADADDKERLVRAARRAQPALRLVRFYVKEYNETIPRSALNGRTPSDVYFGEAVDVPEVLTAARAEARAARIEANRARKCDDCPTAGSFEQLAANG